MGALFLRNARVVRMDRVERSADAVLSVDGRIRHVGKERDLLAPARDVRAGDIDLGGRTLVPGFIDAHLHLLAYAASLVAVDCRPSAAPSIAAVQAAIRARAAETPAGDWIRASGYDERGLAERRHPTRRDLDEAAPEHPVRLTHRGGHACVLNSRAMALAGIAIDTPEPPGGFMDRAVNTGEPSGLLVEMDALVDRAVPPLDAPDLRQAVGRASQGLLEAGITCVQDATHTNGREEWGLVRSFVEEGILRQAASMMEGFDHPGELPGGDAALRRGPIKVMLRELEHEFWPPAAELASMLRRVATAGRSAAVHTVTRRGLDAVLEAFEALRSGAGHRIEHCGLCSAEQATRIARLGLTVVTQPGFLYANGDFMLERAGEVDLPDLYPLQRLLDAGVTVAGSTDAPVIEPDVIASIRGAVERRSRSGAVLAPEQAITGVEALALFTSSAAGVMGLARERGAIAPGLAADFAVLSADPASPGVDWDALRVDMTIMGGNVVFEARPGRAGQRV